MERVVWRGPRVTTVTTATPGGWAKQGTTAEKSPAGRTGHSAEPERHAKSPAIRPITLVVQSAEVNLGLMRRVVWQGPRVITVATATPGGRAKQGTTADKNPAGHVVPCAEPGRLVIRAAEAKTVLGTNSEYATVNE